MMVDVYKVNRPSRVSGGDDDEDDLDYVPVTRKSGYVSDPKRVEEKRRAAKQRRRAQALARASSAKRKDVEGSGGMPMPVGKNVWRFDASRPQCTSCRFRLCEAPGVAVCPHKEPGHLP